MAVDTVIAAPNHLSKEISEWYESVVADWDLEEHHRRLLILAAEAWDRCAAARRAIAKHGLTFTDRFGQPHARPEIGIERDSRLAFARLLRELGLDVFEPDESRPDAIRGNASRRR